MARLIDVQARMESGSISVFPPVEMRRVLTLAGANGKDPVSELVFKSQDKEGRMHRFTLRQEREGGWTTHGRGIS